jgi:hypothetical protein
MRTIPSSNRRPFDSDAFSTGSEEYDRAEILEAMGLPSDITDFANLIEIAQTVAAEIFANAAIICLKDQREYMSRKKISLDVENFRIMQITANIMRDVCGFDVAVDRNAAFTHLERLGYDITSISDREELN